MGKFVSLVWDGVKLSVPTEMGNPLPHQLLSTPLDNLIELAGRVCYDSLGSKKSRASGEYHQHIIEVGHLSVQEHANFTVFFSKEQIEENCSSEMAFILSLLNRPGLWVKKAPDGYRLTFNIRTAREWNAWGAESQFSWITEQVAGVAAKHAPLAMQGVQLPEIQFIQAVSPSNDDEIWVSLLIHSVSRGLTHELVRHGDYTGISQRSTRFVDEHESPYAWHPLIVEFAATNDAGLFFKAEQESRSAYGTLLSALEEFVKGKGVDKFTARKQARGAARGVLGNALATELIFSANLSQYKRIIALRAHPAADAEIRLLAGEIFDVLSERFPDSFSGWRREPAPDGYGFSVLPPETVKS